MITPLTLTFLYGIWHLLPFYPFCSPTSFSSPYSPFSSGCGVIEQRRRAFSAAANKFIKIQVNTDIPAEPYSGVDAERVEFS